MFFSIRRFNNVLLIDATGRSNISSDQKRLFFAVSLYPLSFFANTSFKLLILSNPSFTFSTTSLIYATVQCFVQLPETCKNMSIIIFQESKNFKYLWSTAFKSAWVNTRNMIFLLELWKNTYNTNTTRFDAFYKVLLCTAQYITMGIYFNIKTRIMTFRKHDMGLKI